MATRFYFTSQQNITITPDASWEQTANAIFRNLSTTRPTYTFATTLNGKSTGANPGDVLMGQFVSEPLAAQTINGDVKGIIRALESAASADMRAQMNIRVITAVNTVRGTLLAHDTSALSNEFDATTLTNRKFPVNWTGSGTALSSVVAESGDRIVIEIGFRGFTGAGPNASLEFTGANATDLAENETDVLQNTPWIEFSADLVFEDFSGRQGAGTDFLTRLGATNQGGLGSRGESYASGDAPQEQEAYPQVQPSVRSSRMDPMRIEAGGGIPLHNFGYYGDFAAVVEGSVPSLRDPRETVNFTAGSSATPFYKMRALTNPGPGYTTWTVTDNPDFAGAQAPGAIQPGTAVIADFWLEV